MPKKNLSSVFKSSEGLTQLYRAGKLDTIIDKYSDIINETNHLGGSKCSTFLLPDKKTVLKLTLNDIGYFKKGYCRDFMQLYEMSEIEPVHFFRKHINSLDLFFAPMKKILYHDENVFIYTQDCCIPLRKYKDKSKSGLLESSVVTQVLEFLIYMIDKDVLVTEIGPGNLGVYYETHKTPKLILFDYDTVKPLRAEMRKNLYRWWGFQLGSMLTYLSYVFKPNKSKWYYTHRHKWGKTIDDFKSIKKDFPSYVHTIIEAYTCPKTNSPEDIEDQLNIIKQRLKKCISEINNY